MSYVVRLNGRGNAWPIELGAPQGPGSRHTALAGDFREYANTSFSIIREDAHGNQEWSVLIDVGMGIVDALVRGGNRLPDAVVITHPHFDHVAGLDWLVASHSRHGVRPKLPVYATERCWADIMTRFSWLAAGTELCVLPLGHAVRVSTASGLQLKALPVFHGDYAPGASMILTELQEAESSFRVLFTGDLLCPLLRRSDVEELRAVVAVFADCNTRFPWPRSNHWSIVVEEYRKVLETWDRYGKLEALRRPHAGDPSEEQYFSGVDPESTQLFWAVDEFVEAIAAKNVCVVHYSGYEDAKHHGRDILSDEELVTWIRGGGARAGSVEWHIPRPGQLCSIGTDGRLTWR